MISAMSAWNEYPVALVMLDVYKRQAFIGKIRELLDRKQVLFWKIKHISQCVLTLFITVAQCLDTTCLLYTSL